MNAPLFSFVVPVYNSEAFLPRCIESLLGQTFEDFEIIIVDDCSPGGCAEVLKAYSDSRIRYTRHEKNSSLLQARITGARLAKGQYVVPVDSDDYVGLELLAMVRQALKINPDTDGVFYHTVTVCGDRVMPSWHNHPAGLFSATEMKAVA